MSTSGSYSYSQNKLQILTNAYALINIGQEGSDLSSYQLSYASDALNLMLKHWETNSSIKLWKRQEAVLFTNLNQQIYQLGSVSGADNATNNYVSTTTTAIISNTSSTIPVTSTDGMTIGQNIGLELDNNTRQWGTITNISSNILTASFSANTTSAIGNTVIVFTSLINRPLKLLRMSALDLKNNNTETIVDLVSYNEYFNLPNKNTSGSLPVNAYYDYILNNSVPFTGSLYVYPVQNVVSTILTFTYYDCIQDMLNNTDTLDLPQEWQKGVIWNLAADLAIPNGKFTEYDKISPIAEKLKIELEKYDSDDASLSLRPAGHDWDNAR